MWGGYREGGGEGRGGLSCSRREGGKDQAGAGPRGWGGGGSPCSGGRVPSSFERNSYALLSYQCGEIFFD